MFTYTLRSESGRLIAHLSNKDAGVLLNSVKGSWMKKSFTDGIEKQCFVIKQEGTFGNVNLRVAFYEGYYLSEV